MATATPTENEVVQQYYEFMEFVMQSKFSKTEMGELFLMSEEKLQRMIVEKLLRAYDLGKMSVQNKEKDSGFDILKYLCRD